MVGMLIAAAGTAFVVLIGEWLWQKKITKGEYARKFVHIGAATFAAFWPIFVSRSYIALLSIIFVITLVIIKKLRIFKSFQSIRRVTYGETWYALSIGVCALVFKSDAIYAVTVLHMALADGFAAVVGVSLAKRAKGFLINGCRKSIAGTLTFFIISFTLNILYWLYAASQPLNGAHIYSAPVFYSLISACLLSIAEVISPKGSDNVIVPIIAGALIMLPTTFWIT